MHGFEALSEDVALDYLANLTRIAKKNPATNPGDYELCKQII